MTLRYLDICSGISAPTMAWHPLGWRPLCFAEIEAAPRAVLAHHYPDVPLRGDFTEIEGDEYGPVDLLVGGTPCQDFSVAGLRAGLDGERGNLSLEYLRLADRARPRWLVWENVPGVLSIDGGRAFGAILGGMAQLGYGFAYRVLDAQHFGVPQRRRRVFVVGYLGDWRRAAAVLFERHSLSGHPAPRRQAREGIAAFAANGIGSYGPGVGSLRAEGADCGGGSETLVHCPDIVPQAMSSKWAKGSSGPSGPSGDECANLIAHSLRAEGFDASEDGTGRGTPLAPVAIHPHCIGRAPNAGPQGKEYLTDGSAYTCDARGVPQAIAFNITPSNSNKDYNARESERAQALTAGGNRPSARGGDMIVDTLTSNGDAHSGFRDEKGLVPVIAFGGQMSTVQTDAELSQTLQRKNPQAVATASAVRRLTPRECERLQGFPDDFTLVTHRGKPMADGPRYKMLGNSMAVPVVRWIGERIAAVESLCQQAEAA